MTIYKKSKYNVIFDYDGNRYFHNIFSGTLMPLASHLEERLNEKETFNPEEDTLADELVGIGALASVDFAETEFLREIGFEINSPEDIQGMNLWVLTTERCNYRCFYCYEDRRQTREMTYSAKDLVDFFRRFPNLRRLNITWFGGEPLLNMAKIEELSIALIDYCREHDISFSTGLISNAVFLTPDILTRLRELKLSSVQITLDGARETHEKYKGGPGTFDTVINNLYACAAQMPVSVRLNTNKGNVDSLKQLLAYLAERGLDNLSVHVAPITQNIGTDDDFSAWTPACYTSKEFAALEEEIYQELRALGYQGKLITSGGARVTYCGATSNQFYVVGVDGKIAKCPEFSGRPDQCIGDIFSGLKQDSFTHAWLRLKEDLPGECLECKVLPICMGGCPLQQTGKSTAGDSCLTVRNNLLYKLQQSVQAVHDEAKGAKFFHRSIEKKVRDLKRVAISKVLTRDELRKRMLSGGLNFYFDW